MSTLSSVVSNLVRAQMGASVPSTVSDDDLDRHVAELILKEAKQKLQRYSKDGIRAYLPQPESNAPKTNKRFLSSIIRSTDDHNKTILRAQAQAAQELREERLEEERRERRARAEEAVQAERMRRLMGRGGRVDWSRNRDRGNDWRSRDDEDEDGDGESSHRSRKGKERESRNHREKRRSRRHRSRSPSRDRDEESSSRRHRRERARSASPPRSTDSSHERKKDRREYRRSHHRSHRSHSRDYEAGSSTHEHGRRKHDRSRRDREHRSRSGTPPERQERKVEPGIQSLGSQQASSIEDGGRTPIPDESRSEAAMLSASRSSSVPRISQKRKRSPSTVVGPPMPPSAEPSEDAPEDKPIQKLKELAIESRGSTSRSRASTPIPTRELHNLKAPTDTSSKPSRPHLHGSTRHKSPSPAATPPKRSRTRTTRAAPPQPASSPPPLPAHLPSKMDKYFEETYDPRLDVAPLALPTIPATGLISDAEFAGWDTMLEVIRQRREDKEEKKRLDRWGISDKEKDKDKKKKSAEGTSEAVDIMSIEYKKRGAVREWDLGKEGF